MASVRISRLLLFALLGPWLICVQTETVVSPAPTMLVDNPEVASGGGASDITTKDPFHDHTELVFTHSQTLDEDFGTLGPGALSAIVVTVFLGASVLLALLVITLRRFAAP